MITVDTHIIICATSILSNSPLVTADKNLRKAKSVKANWKIIN